MSSLYKQFSTNKTLERAGIAVAYPDDDAPENTPTPTFHIARSGGSNVAFQKALDRETRPLRRAIATDNVSVETMNRVHRKVFIEACLLGWDDVVGKDGKPLSFSKANAEILFTDLPELYDDLLRQSSTVSLFRAVAETDEKN